MAFIRSNNTVLAFADSDDVRQLDQRLFEANEGLSDDDILEDATIRSTERILFMIRSTDWWKSYYIRQSAGNVVYTSGLVEIPVPNANLILNRQNDFSELCAFHALYEYLLPKVADFSNEDSAEVRKIGVYREKFNRLFEELIQDGSWYDFNSDGTITNLEKMPTVTNLRRVR